ncbi:hypothetical protein MMC30_004187 [Trapelia coarctata]|nr:hypothetical protein [Trapelia coarctata]
MTVLSVALLLHLILLASPSTAHVTCSPTFGHSIHLPHCHQALTSFALLAQGLHIHGLHTIPARFSRDASLVGPLHHLPQSFVWKTCAIGIDIADASVPPPPPPPPGALPSNMISATPQFILNELINPLLGACVETYGQGGRLERFGWDVVVVNPAAGVAYGTCLAPKTPGGVSLGRCVAAQASANERVTREGQAGGRDGE